MLLSITLGVMLCLSSLAASSEYNLLSPDGKIKVDISCTESELSYSLAWKGRELLKPSPLSLFPNPRYKVLSTKTASIDKRWDSVWGQFSEVHDRCEELTLTLDISGVRVDLICRVYNDGLGFRFAVPGQKGVSGKKAAFVVTYNPVSKFAAYATAGEHEPIGPMPLSELAEKDRILPILLSADENTFLGLLESDLYSATGFDDTASLSTSSGIACSISSGTMQGTRTVTPWRVIILNEQAGALSVSTTPINLAAECKLEDTSWIKPGKSLWDWRVHGYKAGDFTYGIDTASYKRFIDFAADNNIRYFLIDDTWFKKVKAGKLMIKPEVDLRHLMEYAQEKNVAIILYYDRKKGASLGDEALFKLYSELGAAGIKYGFMGNNVPFTRRAVEQAARNHLLVDFHDYPAPMTGIRRTLPNFVTREFGHTQQDARRAFTPQGFLKMAMINSLSGPIDQNNGTYGLDEINSKGRLKSPLKRESYNSTVVSETARVLVVFSGLIILPDAPEEYAKKADLFEFIRQMPATWDESRIINSRIGEHITTARRSGDQWFVASVIDGKGGSLKIPLEFLEPGKSYHVTFYEDAPEAHFIKNREAYQIRTGNVTGGDTIEARMAPGGGHCMWIRPAGNDRNGGQR